MIKIGNTINNASFFGCISPKSVRAKFSNCDNALFYPNKCLCYLCFDPILLSCQTRTRKHEIKILQLY